MKKIGKHISIVYRALNSEIDEELSEFNITRSQYPYLFALYHEEGIPQKALCERYNLDKGTVGRTLDKLEKKNLIKRKKDPKDNRKHLIYLTEKSKELEPELRTRMQKIEENITQGLTEEEISAFFNVIKTIYNNLDVDIDCKEDC